MKRQWIARVGTVWVIVVMIVGWGIVRAAETAGSSTPNRGAVQL